MYMKKKTNTSCINFLTFFVIFANYYSRNLILPLPETLLRCLLIWLSLPYPVHPTQNQDDPTRSQVRSHLPCSLSSHTVLGALAGSLSSAIPAFPHWSPSPRPAQTCRDMPSGHPEHSASPSQSRKSSWSHHRTWPASWAAWRGSGCLIQAL